jgi:hypothetical protein
MSKIGRNQSCPCGSGKKYKRCHGYSNGIPNSSIDMPPDVEKFVQQMFAKHKAERVQREKQQGLGKPIVSWDHNGTRMVTVGNTVYHSKEWGTFQDFLRFFLVDTFGRDWFQSEIRKAENDRHPVLQWHEMMKANMAKHGKKSGAVYTVPASGAHRAFMHLAYNIYLIAHHAEPEQLQQLLGALIGKLKSSRLDDFIGKLFETYAAAAFLKAGFQLEYKELNKSAESTVEFVATYPTTGRKFSVEVKSRVRQPNEDELVEDYKRLRVANKLNRALAKNADHERVVMIEVNVADQPSGERIEGWLQSAVDQVRHAEKMPTPDGSAKPSAYVFMTNHSFHNNLNSFDAGVQFIGAGCNIPDFGTDVVFDSLAGALNSEERHKEILALADSMREHYNIPNTFDGENPVFAFNPEAQQYRLKIGQIYKVPDAEGKETDGRLVEAIVTENDKSFHGVFEVSGQFRHIRGPLTDMEFEAWKLHPETFFGEIRKGTKQVSNWLEMARFMFETYQHTKREVLIDWMKGAVDVEVLNRMTHRQLAIEYCQSIALQAEAKSN